MKLSLSSFPVHATNPSQANLRRYARIQPAYSSDGDRLTNTDTGETGVFKKEASGLIVKDSGEFTKLFDPAIDKLNRMGRQGLSLFFYLTTIISKDKDDIRLDIPSVMKYTGYTSRNAVYGGVVELLDSGFLFRKTGESGSFFINVEYFFNGRRTSLGYFAELRDRVQSGAIDIKAFNKTEEE